MVRFSVTMPLRRLGPSIALALAANVYGCGDGLTLPGDATPSQIDIVTGNAQAGTAGSVLPLPLVVKVTDGLGRPVVGQGVTFTVTGGGGGVAPASVETDTAGRASLHLDTRPRRRAAGGRGQGRRWRRSRRSPEVVHRHGRGRLRLPHRGRQRRRPERPGQLGAG